MTKRIVLSLALSAAFAGTALAQTPATKPADKAAPAAPAAKPADKAAPAAPAAKPADKAAAPAAKPADKAAPAATDKAAPPAGAPAMEWPAPSETLLTTAKALQGNWKCTGTIFMPDGTSRESKATIMNKLDLDKMWILTTMKEQKSKANPHPFSFVQYRTHDAKTGKWASVMVDNMGGWSSSSSSSAAGGPMAWEGKGHMGAMTMWMKDTEEMKSPKEAHYSGQMSMDGKKWMPAYDITCKK